MSELLEKHLFRSRANRRLVHVTCHRMLLHCRQDTEVGCCNCHAAQMPCSHCLLCRPGIRSSGPAWLHTSVGPIKFFPLRTTRCGFKPHQTLRFWIWPKFLQEPFPLASFLNWPRTKPKTDASSIANCPHTPCEGRIFVSRHHESWPYPAHVTHDQEQLLAQDWTVTMDASCLPPSCSGKDSARIEVDPASSWY